MFILILYCSLLPLMLYGFVYERFQSKMSFSSPSTCPPESVRIRVHSNCSPSPVSKYTNFILFFKYFYKKRMHWYLSTVNLSCSSPVNLKILLIISKKSYSNIYFIVIIKHEPQTEGGHFYNYTKRHFSC